MTKEIQQICGFRKQSSIRTVCESIAVRQYDRFHDEKWDYRSANARALAAQKRKAKRAAALASL